MKINIPIIVNVKATTTASAFGPMSEYCVGPEPSRSSADAYGVVDRLRSNEVQNGTCRQRREKMRQANSDE